MNIELLPTMSAKSNSKNQVWVGTFQLVWNDLVDELIKEPVQFVDYNSKIVDELNKKLFSKDELSESSYYKKFGLVSQSLKTEIEHGIKSKFDETSGILESVDWTPADKKYLLYAMLKKDFVFIETLQKTGKGSFYGSDNDVEYFGLDDNATFQQRKSVKVLFYNGQNDFAVQLKSKTGDVINFYRTDDEKFLDEYFGDLNKKTKKTIDFLNDEDTFEVPMIDFNIEREFEELSNKQIKGTDFEISKAVETLQFKMDEVGAKLKSEAAIIMERGCLFDFKPEPRQFLFNSQFVMFISEEGKKPYFALKVADAAKLQKS